MAELLVTALEHFADGELFNLFQIADENRIEQGGRCRVVEMMSDRVVQEIAWEIVPDLAELHIKRRLDEQAL